MCGIAGISGHPEAARLVHLMMYAQQHRGQEAAGITARNPSGDLVLRRRFGLVAKAFPERVLETLSGDLAIGHNRYSTAGGKSVENIQPITFRQVAVAHNGNLTNAAVLREQLDCQGRLFRSTSDTEVIPHLMARSRAHTPLDQLVDALGQVHGAYSLLVITNDGTLFVARDPHGFRPLVLGKLNGAMVVASETCAFDLIGAEYEREINPGEVLAIKDGGIVDSSQLAWQSQHACIFELMYFARPDSRVFGQLPEDVRHELGRELGREHPVAGADRVVPVLASGLHAAIGYATQTGIPFRASLTRNNYLQRTFIEPTKKRREFSTLLKHNASPGLEGKRVVLVDDSVVRGTTSKHIVDLVRARGATEVHLRVSAPPSIAPCHFGIDTPTAEELVASSRSLEQIRALIGVDSLEYLSIEGMYKAVGIPPGKKMCAACFTGRYPIPINAG